MRNWLIERGNDLCNYYPNAIFTGIREKYLTVVVPWKFAIVCSSRISFSNIFMGMMGSGSENEVNFRPKYFKEVKLCSTRECFESMAVLFSHY